MLVQVFLTPEYLAISMEYAKGGDMFQYVKTKGGLQVSIILRGMRSPTHPEKRAGHLLCFSARAMLKAAWPLRRH